MQPNLNEANIGRKSPRRDGRHPGDPPAGRGRPNYDCLRAAGGTAPLVKRALRPTLDQLNADPTVRCQVLTGTGRAFSVGSDIHDFSQDVGWLFENDYWEAG